MTCLLLTRSRHSGVSASANIVDDRIVVVRRKSRLRDAPGIRPGTVITKLNGLTLHDFVAQVTEPPVPAIPSQMLATERAGRELFRNAGESVEVTYVDEGGAEVTDQLTAFARDGAVDLLEGIRRSISISKAVYSTATSGTFDSIPSIGT